jgi:hypothetical protein
MSITSLVPTVCLRQFNYDVAAADHISNCNVAVGSGTAVRVLGSYPKPPDWLVEAKSIVVMDCPFAGLHGYIHEPSIHPKRMEAAFKFSDQVPEQFPARSVID